MTQTAHRPRPLAASEVAHRSRVAGGGPCGGDFAVVVTLPDGRLGIGVGDVAGHGNEVSGLMRRLRGAMFEEALTGAAPDALLARLNARLAAMDAESMATAAFAVLDPASHTVVCASAGHLPFLCVTGDGAGEGAWPAQVPVGLPLGVCADAGYDTALAVLPPGASILAYSDGLVERRGEDIDAGLRRLADLAGTWSGSGLRHLVDGLFPRLGASSTDDVTLVAVRLLPQPEPDRLAV